MWSCALPEGVGSTQLSSQSPGALLQQTVDHNTEVDSNLPGDQLSTELLRLCSTVYVDSTLLPHQLLILLKSKTVNSSKKSEQEDLNSVEMMENILPLSFKVLIASQKVRHISDIPYKWFILGANQQSHAAEGRGSYLCLDT